MTAVIAVRVEEITVRTYTGLEAVTWWETYRGHGPAERFVAVETRYPGDLVDVLCHDREHAEWLHAHLAARGIPKAALTIVTREEAAA